MLRSRRFNTEVMRGERYSDEELFKKARRIHEKLGHLTQLDWENETRIRIATIRKRFVSFAFCKDKSDLNENFLGPFFIMPTEYWDEERSRSVKESLRLHDALMGNWWNTFLVLAGIPPYDLLTKDQVIETGVELVRAEGVKRITPELWNRSLAPVIKYFDSWESFEQAVSQEQ